MARIFLPHGKGLKMDYRKTFIVVASAALVGGGAYVAYKLWTKRKEEAEVYSVTERDVLERMEEIREMGDDAYSVEPLEEEPDNDEGMLIAVNNDAYIEEGVDDEDMHVDSVFEMISMEEFEGIKGSNDYDKISATYYSNGVLVGDDKDNPPMDIDDSVGQEAIDYLVNNSYSNVIYVRNNYLGCDFEVVAVPEEYTVKE